MSHEISQITGRHRVFPAQPTVGTWTDIGKAEVVHTMFGKAKVRIIREQGENRRTGRLLMVLAATALCAAAWQGWVASVQSEVAQSSDSSPAVATVQHTAPALQTDAPPPAMPPSVQDQPTRPAETETPPVSQRVVSPEPSAVTAAEQPAAKPAVRLKADASQNVAVAAGESGSIDPKGTVAPAKLPSAKQPAEAAIVTPRIAKADAPAPAAAGSPAAKAPAMTSPINEPSPSPAMDKQPAVPLSGPTQ